MSDPDEPEDRRTEGVRIIGAQEAAEAAGRPDVVRRRRGGEKRYGDRPDEPEPTSDLPKITISTTETEAPDLEPYGSTPVVRPGADAPGGDAGPRWADDEGEPVREHSGFGHARIVPEDTDVPDDLDLDLVLDSGEVSDAGVDVEREATSTWSAVHPDDAAEEAKWADHARWAAGEDTSTDLVGDLGGPGALTGFGDRDEPDELEAAGAVEDPYDDSFAAEPRLVDDEVADDDDSFVLPHWTEPATGQVPKVVIGDDADSESLATYGSQPRWRDEGERETVPDFDDLVDDEPRLGALGSSSVEDDFFDEGDDDLYDDRFEELYDEDDELVAAPRRGSSRPRREPAESRSGGGGGDRDLVSAVAVGVALVGLGLLCFFLGDYTTAALATVVVAIAAWEYFTAVRERGHNPATLLGMVAVLGVMIATFTSGLAAYPVVFGLTVIFGLLWYLWVAPGERAVQNLGLTLLGVLWIGGLGSFATLFVGLGRLLTEADESLTSNPGIGVLIAAIVATVSHDVGAYFIGRQFGRTPLSAASPNKTQEGLAGGAVTSLLATVLVVGLIGIEPIGGDLARTFVFALLCALAAPLGDLCESFVKRDLHIKDMGSLLPGHGGVLDRFDGLLFVLPVAYFVTVLFDIWGTIGS